MEDNKSKSETNNHEVFPTVHGHEINNSSSSDLEEEGQEEVSHVNDTDDEAVADDIPNIPENIMRIDFDVIRTKLLQSGRRKYTVYVIIVIEMPRLDADRAIIERRYNEFYRLHKGLLKQCPKVMKNVPMFPKKKFFGGNFENYLIENRCRLFEKYLRYLYHQEGVIESTAFREFFFKPHLKLATESLKYEDYEKSFQQYQLAFHLQKKLGCNDKEDRVIAMCGVVETCKNLKNFKRALEVGNECLRFINYDVSNPYLLGLMQTVMDARKREMVALDELKAKFRDCLHRSVADHGNIKTLRELLVRKY